MKRTSEGNVKKDEEQDNDGEVDFAPLKKGTENSAPSQNGNYVFHLDDPKPLVSFH